MNHIAREFTSRDGRSYRRHSWELRQDGYRRIALCWGNGLWPVSEETRLVAFLAEKGFKATALDLAFGSARGPRAGLRAFREAAASLVADASAEGLPIYLIAPSFSASALMAGIDGLGRLDAMAFIAPVLRFPPSGLQASFPCLSSATVRVDAASLSGEPALLDGHMDQPLRRRFRRADLRALAARPPLDRAAELAGRTAVFAGEEDPDIPVEDLRALKEAGVRVYSYPRVRREPGRDRYADNFFADLGAFLDEMESSRRGAKRR